MDISVEANVGGGGVISLRTEQDICRIAQTCEIEVEGVATCNYWDELAASINGTPRFAGYVEEVIIHSDGHSTVRGIDKMKRAIDIFIDEEVEVTEEKDAGWWIAYWLDVAGVPNSGPVETGRTVPGDISWQYQFVSDIILECLGYAGGGYVVIVDSSGVAQIQEKTIGASGHTLDPIKFSRTQDDNWYRDRAVVFGTTSGSWVDGEWVPGEVTIVAEAGSGDRTAVLSSIYVQSQASAEDLADEILAFFDEYLDVKRCLIEGDESIWLGDSASISAFGYSGTGVITSIETTVDDSGFRQLVSLDEKCGFIWGHGKPYGQMMFAIPGTLTTGDTGRWFLCDIPDGITMLNTIAAVKTPSEGASIQTQIETSTDGVNWTSQHTNTITADQRLSGILTGFTQAFVDIGTLVRANVTQIGDEVAGADITVSVGMKIGEA